MRSRTLVLGGPPSFVVVCMLLPACATYKTTLTNDQGETITCEASGKSGIVTGYYLKQGYEQCVHDAKEAGYKGRPARSAPASAAPDE